MAALSAEPHLKKAFPVKPEGLFLLKRSLPLERE